MAKLSPAIGKWSATISGVAGSFVFGELIDERPIVPTIQTHSTAPLMKEKPSPHRGSDFDDFLKGQGIYEEVMASPKLKKVIRDLGDSIQGEMHEAFAAGWNAFLATHSGLLIAHGIKDFRIGFEAAWAKYWQSRKAARL
jgi:hypothetical protein